MLFLNTENRLNVHITEFEFCTANKKKKEKVAMACHVRVREGVKGVYLSVRGCRNGREWLRARFPEVVLDGFLGSGLLLWQL